ncbi:type IV pilus assembly protein PilV [Collimonas sp. PA-H2]|uniref:type IV pilus modification protein PilV n=1 Tax=Collimonas sp. PA-H2 TaxID=1881062 RepID=UPI000BF802B2|nr:type IV pilus modification protein PilV [Collimonas sp. PA-H2]PFH11998.1 type IV pilus assembly protein PilV [Collimonas sp. PA-H2]
MNLKRKSSRHSGFALLEVLIAVVVLAFGMLGIAGLLLTAHKANSSSYIKQQAVQSAYDVIDRVRANSQTAINGGYAVNNITTGGTPVIPAAASPDCSTTACSATQLAAYDVWYWLAKDLAQLPSGSGSIVTGAAPTGNNTLVTIVVQWDDSPAQGKLGAASQTQASKSNLAQFTVQTLL